MSRTDHISERALALLLEHRGIPFVPEDGLEQAVAIREGKRPDFCLKVGPPHVLVEVTELIARGPFDGLSATRGGAMNPRLITGRIKHEIKGEMPQLRPYGKVGHPTIVVLANPRRVGVPLDLHWLLQVFGELAITMPFDGARLDASQAVMVHTGNRVLSDHQGRHLSAVAVLRGFPPTSSTGDLLEPLDANRLNMRIVHNPFAQVPLDPKLFKGPADQTVIHDDARQDWIDAATGQPISFSD